MTDPTDPNDPSEPAGPTDTDSTGATEPAAAPEGAARRGASRRRLGLALLAVLVPVVPIVAAVLVTGSAARTPAHPGTRTAAYQPVAGGAASRARAHRRSQRDATALPGGRGALVAYIDHPRSLHASPGGRRIGALGPKTTFGSPTFVLVTRVRHGWLGIVSTAAGNDRLGWIRAAGVALHRDVWRLHAVLARHTLYVLRDGHAIRHMTIATGKPTAPTPTGLFAVTDRLTTGDPGGPYGCCILALSATAPHHISDWDGGNRIAIHSTPETDSIGYSVSHGCMRLSLADGQWLIDHIPLGTPTLISSA